MSYFKILIDTSDIKTSRELDRLSSNDPKESFVAIQLLEADGVEINQDLFLVGLLKTVCQLVL